MRCALSSLVIVAGCGATAAPPPPPAMLPVMSAGPELAAPASPTASAPPAAPLPDAVREIQKAAPRGFAIVRSLTDEVGPRLAGSPGDKAAVAWALRALAAEGLTDVRAEKV